MEKGKGFEWYRERGLPVPGSAEEIAIRNRAVQKAKDEAKAEAEVREASKDFPEIGRLFDILKKQKGGDQA